jgi:sugar phosphate isomerase/epimerase
LNAHPVAAIREQRQLVEEPCGLTSSTGNPETSDVNVNALRELRRRGVILSLARKLGATRYVFMSRVWPPQQLRSIANRN